jgi:hypothetical protein
MHNQIMGLSIPDIYAIRLANLDVMVALVRKVDIAKKMGQAQNYLSQVHSKNKRDGLKPIGTELARNIERAVRELGLGWVHDNWMDVPHSPIDVGEHAPARVHRPPSKPAKVIAWEQVGGIDGMMTLDGPGSGDDEFVDAPASAGIGTFALRVRGDSMTNPAGMPSYPPDCVIIVDPTKEPKPGSAVIVKLPDTPEAVFKILELYDGRKHLKPLNPRYPIAPMPDEARIVGVVILMHYVPPE